MLGGRDKVTEVQKVRGWERYGKRLPVEELEGRVGLVLWQFTWIFTESVFFNLGSVEC